MNSLSICIVTYNEEHNLPRLLKSIEGIADEIVVVDSGSKDGTRDIALASGARVLERPFKDFADQKNYAAEQSTYDWVLTLDADEELSEELRKSLLEWKEQEPDRPVYEMARLTWYLGAWIRHSRWYPDWQRKLYRKDAAHFEGGTHGALRFEGAPARLKGDLLHYTIRSFPEHEAKVDRYTTAIAKEMFDQGRKDWRGAMWFATPWSWIHHFFVGAGFLDGYRGALIAQMAARSTRLKFKKLGALVEANKQERKPSEA